MEATKTLTTSRELVALGLEHAARVAPEDRERVLDSLGLVELEITTDPGEAPPDAMT